MRIATWNVNSIRSRIDRDVARSDHWAVLDHQVAPHAPADEVVDDHEAVPGATDADRLSHRGLRPPVEHRTVGNPADPDAAQFDPAMQRVEHLAAQDAHLAGIVDLDRPALILVAGPGRF